MEFSEMTESFEFSSFVRRSRSFVCSTGGSRRPSSRKRSRRLRSCCAGRWA